MTMNENLMRFSIASGITLALLVGVASAATAKEVTVVGEPQPEDQLTREIVYRDLDLTSPDGVQGLYRRVGRAVRHVCAPDFEGYYLDKRVACTTQAWGGARPQIARAIARAEQIAANGTSSLAPVAIVIAAPAN